MTMTIRQALREATDALRAADKLDAALDARYLLAHALHADATALLLRADEAIDADALAALRTSIQRRIGGEPLSYILGEQPFFGLPFCVDDRVLIPRQDTETLAEEAVRRARAIPGCRALDLGTGSGALAVCLARLAGARVVAVDISEGALAVARRNAERNGTSIEFRHGDFLDALCERDSFDIVVSNPPYIETDEIATLMPEVRREPALALDGGPDGLRFYRALASGIAPHLSERGVVLMEVGAGQADAVRHLFAGWKTSTVRDTAGIERVVIAQR